MDLGDRQKFFEKNLIPNVFPKEFPVVARIDGRTFSRVTRGLKRPFDERLSNLMVEVTKFLVTSSGASLGYTQSDEISLVFMTGRDSEMWFGGKSQKLVSILASGATVKFNHLLSKYGLEDLAEKLPTFDARVWFVPNVDEANNYLRWRQLDATKNSVTMAAREYFSDKEIFKVPTQEKKEMLLTKGVDWNDYPDFFKKGTYVKRQEKTGRFSEEELKDLPPKHFARQNPNVEFSRNVVEIINVDAFKDKIL